jgi:AraC family transcriptional regulator, regulatory protein of adaptative response / methylated-DNA-[protein]-cysteine methyltransferase
MSTAAALPIQTPAHVEQVRRACLYIERHADEPLTLASIAAHVDASPYHFQRTFTRIVGISPRAYQDALRAKRFRRDLRKGSPVAGAIYEAGYGSSSRVYERLPTGRGMTPAVYKRGAHGVDVRYAVADSPLGRLLVAATPRGICSVKLGDSDEQLAEDLRSEYPAATISADRSDLTRWVDAILTYLGGRRPHLELPVDVQATAFQWKVWRYLQSIPYGETRAYSQVAKAIGAPAAVRAVARACATNPVCLVIPCHRVVGKNGSLTGYRWGVERKRRLIDAEKKGTRQKSSK